MNENDPDQERPEGAPDPEAPAVCPGCGGTIPAEAPAGLCPRCLLAEAEADTMRESASGMTTGGTGSAGPGWGAPPLERIQAAFPGLEILELIGCGGMGAVFKARQPKLDRLVALKILPEKLAHSPAFTERFTREGRALARLSHPNIVGVHDFGEAGGFFFLLMEYVDGVNLRQAMQAGRFTPQQALAVVPEICAALQFAHDQGVLHRDIKPENILLDARGRVKIADFGIAKIVAEPGTPELTLTQGLAAGTPQYMAPEQIERPRDVDHRADIYSLGVVFYELLTGELPLGRFAPPSNKTPIDARVDAIVLRALEKERELRQQSAGEMRTEIETLSGTGASTPAGPAAASSVSPGFDAPCFLSTPEHARSLTGRLLWVHRARGRLTLSPDRLRFSHHWNALEIPLRSIVRLGLGDFQGKWPVSVSCLVVTFREGGTEKTVFLTPQGGGPLTPAWEANALAEQWRQAVGEATKRLTGVEPPPPEEDLRSVSRSPAWIRMTLGALLVAATVFAFQWLRSDVPISDWRFPRDYIGLFTVLGGLFAAFGVLAFLMRPRAMGELPRRLSAVPAILVGLALLLPLVIAFPLRRAEVDRARSLAELSRLETERSALEHALNTEVALSGQAATPAERAEGATRFDRLSRRRSGIDAEIARLQASSSLAPLSPAAAFWRRASWAILSGAAILLIALPATVFGWRQLGLARAQGPPRPPGIGWAMAAAWTLPALLLLAGGFLLVYLPFEAGQWGGQRRFVLALATIGGLVAGVAAVRWMIVRTLRWLEAVPVAHGMAPAAASKASGAPVSNPVQPAGASAPAALTSPAANPWPRRIFWLIAIVILGPPILIALGLLFPMLAYRAASTQGPAPLLEEAGTPGFPSARHFGSGNWSIYHVGDGNRTHWLLLHEGDLNSSSSGSHNPRTGTWTDEGRLTTPDGIVVDFQRQSLNPDLITLKGTSLDLRDGRVFVLTREGRIVQHDIPVPTLNDDTLATFLAQVRATLDSTSTPGVER